MKRGPKPRYVDLGSSCPKCADGSACDCTPLNSGKLVDLTGRPTKFDKDPSFAVQGLKKQTGPVAEKKPDITHGAMEGVSEGISEIASDEMKRHNVHAHVTEGSVESQELRRKENKKSATPMSVGAVAGQAATIGAMGKIAGEMKKDDSPTDYTSPAKSTDMSILREKQRRSSKGISEWQHFKDKKSVDINEPRVEGTWKKGGKKKK